jgi:tungstate transport system ATP-binding protein
LSDKRIRELIALARVPQALIEVDAASLSVGEAQRVALARLLALEPEVILLDEPTSALDPTLTEGVEATIRDLVARDGISLILVSHDPLQAIRMGGTVLLVSEGRLAESGPARQVIEAPQSAEGKRYKERKYDADS